MQDEIEDQAAIVGMLPKEMFTNPGSPFYIDPSTPKFTDLGLFFVPQGTVDANETNRKPFRYMPEEET